jgi:hypothetical protein
MIKLYDVSCTNPYTVQAALHQLFFSVQKSAELIGDHKKQKLYEKTNHAAKPPDDRTLFLRAPIPI